MSKFSLSDSHLLIKTDHVSIYFNRETMKVCSVPSDFNPIINIGFQYCLGLYQVDRYWFIIFVQAYVPVSVLLNIQTIVNIEVYQITPGPICSSAVSFLKDTFSFCHFFFSKTNDISISYQEQALGKSSNVEYIWNYIPMMNARQYFGDYIEDLLIPILCGTVSSFSTPALEFLLISRRSRLQAAAHYWLRGVDQNGNPANLIETEEIIKFSSGDTSKVLSYVQIRGSIPVIWSEKPTLFFLPPIAICPRENENESAFNLHYYSLFEKYGPVSNINLCRARGRERVLTESYTHFSDKLINNPETVVRVQKIVKDETNDIKNSKDNDNIIFGNNDIQVELKDYLHHFNYDYSASSSRLKQPDFSTILNLLHDDIIRFGVFRMDGEKIISLQKGVFRTNCMDCIDRTNVIQALIGIYIITEFANSSLTQEDNDNLNKKEKAHEKAQKKEESINSKEMEDLIKGARISWAQNADEIAQMVLGTNAQRTDVTLCNTATKDKVIALGKDISKCVKRYVTDLTKNGTRQDDLDAMTQTIPIKIEKKQSEFQTIFMFFTFLILSLIHILSNNKKDAQKEFRKAQRSLINTPSFRSSDDVE